MTIVRPRPREVILPVLAIAVSVLLPFAYRGRLPDPIAVHWGPRGLPDGAMPLAVDHLALAVLVALVVVLPLWAAARADHTVARMLVASANGLAVLLAVLRWWTLEANDGAEVWTDAAAMTLPGASVVVVAALVGAALGWWAARDRPDHVVPSRRVEATPVAVGEELVWIGRQHTVLGRAAAAVAIAVGVIVVTVLPVPVPAAAYGAIVLIALVTANLMSIVVVVGPAGLTVRFGPAGFPRIRVRTADIVEVRVEHVEPLAFGGWGYRIVPGARAVIVRRGEGIRVVRRGAPDLVVTVDGAPAAAGALAAQVAAGPRAT
jgi:hypothetical protein